MDRSKFLMENFVIIHIIVISLLIIYHPRKEELTEERGE